jgi:alcohol dehydrogenase class IV
MQFAFTTAPRILFGRGKAAEIPALARSLGSRPCLVTGGDPARLADLAEALAPVLAVSVAGEPDTETVARAAADARERGCDVVVAVGGGSALDAGKAVAALATNTRDVLDYLEVVGLGLPLTEKPLPLVAAPTTSGTGAEVTANAVLLSREHGVKASLRGAGLVADVAVVDPELAAGMPPHVTAASGMDALTQLVEAFVSPMANPMTDALCREGLLRAGLSLAFAHANGGNMEAREDMALASLFSGMALANARLGAVHGFAAPLGGGFCAPHGEVCAALLPHVMEANIRALRQRDPESPALEAYAEAAAILTGDDAPEPEAGVEWVLELCRHLEIPGLKSMGVKPADLDPLAEQAAKASSMKGNPVELTHKELVGILKKAM